MEAVALHSTTFNALFIEYAALSLSGGYITDSDNLNAANRFISLLEENKYGALVIGNPGSGKTLMFDICQRVINPAANNFFIKINVLEIVLQFNNKEIGHGVFKKWKDKHIFFDDLGTENKGFLFGEKIEVMEMFIQFRYELFRSSKIKTHFTTNLNYQKIKDRYGSRCASRLNEMCEPIVVGGSKNYKDRRELKNFIGLPPVKHLRVLSKDEQHIKEVYAALKEKALTEPKGGSTPLGSRLRESMGFIKK